MENKQAESANIKEPAPLLIEYSKKLPPKEADKFEIDELFRKALDIIEQVSVASAADFLSISDIRIDNTVPTAAIGTRGETTVLFVNPGFVLQTASTPIKFAALLLHEIMHHLLGHTKEANPDIFRAYALDAVINASLYRLNPMFGTLFKDTYSGEIMPDKFLRPQSLVDYDDEESVHRYAALWLPSIYGKGRESDDGYLDEIYGYSEFFKKKMKGKSKKVLLLGSHSSEYRDDGVEEAVIIPDSIAVEIQKQLISAIQEKGWGYCEKIFASRVANAPSYDLNKIAIEITMRELRKIAVRKALTAFGIRGNASERTVFPPFDISRREMSLFGAGIYPAYFSVSKGDACHKEAFVYLDVSGSMGDALPFVYSLLTSLKEYLVPQIFNFSNEVVEITKEDLEKGLCYSTYGTDFDCVCRHFLKQREKKALIITDGYAEVDEDLAAEVMKSKEMTAIITNEIYPTEALKSFCRKVVSVNLRPRIGE